MKVNCILNRMLSPVKVLYTPLSDSRGRKAEVGEEYTVTCISHSHPISCGINTERSAGTCQVECFWNVMAHAQKLDFVFWRNGRVHLNRRWASVQSTTGSRGVRISGSNVGYTMFRGSVKGTGYPLHSPVSPSLPLPCVTMCHHISTGVYQQPRSLTYLYSNVGTATA